MAKGGGDWEAVVKEEGGWEAVAKGEGGWEALAKGEGGWKALAKGEGGWEALAKGEGGWEEGWTPGTKEEREEEPPQQLPQAATSQWVKVAGGWAMEEEGWEAEMRVARGGAPAGNQRRLLCSSPGTPRSRSLHRASAYPERIAAAAALAPAPGSSEEPRAPGKGVAGSCGMAARGAVGPSPPSLCLPVPAFCACPLYQCSIPVLYGYTLCLCSVPVLYARALGLRSVPVLCACDLWLYSVPVPCGYTPQLRAGVPMHAFIGPCPRCPVLCGSHRVPWH